MTLFANIDADGWLLMEVGRPDADDMVGPPAPPGLEPAEGTSLRQLAAPVLRDRPSLTSRAQWLNTPTPVWVETATLAEQRADKINLLNACCTEQIVAGFMCEALGAPYLYPAKGQDQANLIASVTDSLLAGGDPDWRTPFWCMDETGVWEFRPHSITQIQQVGREGKAAILVAMGKNETLRQLIMNADVDELPTINW